MIHETVSALESRLQNAVGLSGEERSELLGLVSALKTELSAQKPQSVRGAIQGLSDALAGQEAQHPQLTELLNSISQVLANTGI